MKISVIFATYNRNSGLMRTLEGMAGMDTSGLDWEVVIVDNAGNAETERIVQSFHALIPVKYIVETTPGKNNALNTALEHADGELLIFTDDDVIPQCMWVRELVAAAGRWANADLFGGRILPAFPEGLTPPDTDHPFIRSAYVIADWDIAEGEISIEKIWGPNMMVRRSVFDQGVRFNPAIGPQGTNYIMGSETDLLRKASALGHTAVYIPSALIYHQIRPEQLTRSWIYGRAFRYGRGRAHSQATEDSKLVLNIPRWRLRQLAASLLRYITACVTGSKTERLSRAIEFHEIRGYIYQRYMEHRKEH